MARSEHLLSLRENLVQRVPEVIGRFGELLANLIGVFLKALLDLFLEDFLERSVAESLVPLRREVRHQIGNQRARQTPCLGVWIVGEEWIDRRLATGRRSAGRRGRRSRRRRRRHARSSRNSRSCWRRQARS